MDFNPYPISRKIKKISHPPLDLNNKSKRVQKHLRVYLDVKLHFREHLHNMFKKINKTISLLRKLQNNSSRAPLVTIYKSHLRPHLDYGNILYDQTFNNSFIKGSNDSILCSTYHTRHCTVKASSRGKIYQKLGLETL